MGNLGYNVKLIFKKIDIYTVVINYRRFQEYSKTNVLM